MAICARCTRAARKATRVPSWAPVRANLPSTDTESVQNRQSIRRRGATHSIRNPVSADRHASCYAKGPNWREAMIRSLAFLTVFVFASSAFAQAYDRNGPSLGAAVGFAIEDFDDDGLDFDNSGVAGASCGYRVHPHIGLEG